MKLSDLHPCDRCGGVLGLTFHVVRTSLVVVDPKKAQEHLALAQMFRGSLRLADAMGPHGGDDDAVKVLAEQKGAGGWDQALLCVDCHALGYGWLKDARP